MLLFRVTIGWLVCLETLFWSGTVEGVNFFTGYKITHSNTRHDWRSVGVDILRCVIVAEDRFVCVEMN